MRHVCRFLLVLLLAFTFWTGTASSQEEPGIQIVKLGSPVVEVGGLMNYSIFVFVNSTIVPQGCMSNFFGDCEIILEDQLPAGFVPDLAGITATKYFPFDAPVPVPCNVTPGNLLTCDIGIPGSFDFEFGSGQFVEVLIPGTAPNVEGPISNTATVTATGPFPNNLIGTDTDTFDTQVIGPGPQADLFVFKTDAPDPVIGEAGSIVTYTLAVGNAGPDDATNVVVQDLLPAGTTFISSVPGNPPCLYNGGLNALQCSFPSLPAGDIEFLTITVAPPVLAIGDPDISMLNIARVFADEADPSPGNNIVAEPTTVVAPGVDVTESDLIVTKTSPDTVIVGQPFSYVVNIFNAGPDTADNVRFRDAPFMGTSINIPGIISSLPTNCVPFPMAPNFRCDLLVPLPAGQSVSFIIPAMYNGPLPLNPTPIFNAANAILGPSTLPNTIQEDPVPGNNTFIEVTNVVPPPPITTTSDLVLTKSVPDIIIPGTVGPPTNTFGYSIEVANLGPDEAMNVIVTDIIPDDVTFLTFSPGAPDCNIVNNPGSMRDELICAVGNIASGDIARVDIRAVYTGVAPIAPSFRAVFNLATADFGISRVLQIDPDTTNNTDVGFSRALIPPQITLSDLDVRKSAPVIIIENEEFSYFLEVTNLGPDEAQNVMLRDLIPADISINPANLGGQGCAIVVDEIECNIGTLTNGQTVNFEFLATYTGMAPDLPGSVPVFNLAQVFFDPAILPGIPPTVQLDLNPSNNTASAISQAIEPPPNINLVDLFVVKVDSPDPVVTEETLTYSLFVYNFGPNDAVDVIVRDILPAGVTVTDDGGCVQAGQTLTCNVPLIQAGTAFIIQIEVDAPTLPDDEPIMIINAARADVNPFALLESDNTIQLDFAPSNNTDYEKTTVVPVPPPLSDLLILKTDTPDPVIEEQELTYTIFVKNTGPDPAFGVLVSDWLPQQGLDLDTVEFSFSPNVAGCEQNPDFPMMDEPYKVECIIPSLGVEESATIDVKVTTLPLPDDLEFLNIFNLAKVESIGDEINPPSADPNPLNNVVVESTLIGEFVPVADLFIIKSDSPDPVVVGQILTYTLFVSNAGPDPATNVVVTDTLPPSVDFISATPQQGACGGPVGDLITCNLGNLAVGAFTEVMITVRPTQPGSILNVGQVMGDQHDPKSSNNISPQTTTVNPRIPDIPDDPEPTGNDLFLLKFVSPNPAEVGDEVLFTIILGNNGQFGSGATVIDDLPPGVTFISATANTGDSCNLVGGDVVCEIGTIPPLGQGQTVVIEVLVRVDQTGTLPNIAFLDEVPNDPNTTNNVSIVAVNVLTATNPAPPQDPGDNPQDPDPVDPGTGGGSNGNGSNGCAVAAGSVNSGSTAFNFALMLLPLLVFGIRSIRRMK